PAARCDVVEDRNEQVLPRLARQLARGHGHVVEPAERASVAGEVDGEWAHGLRRGPGLPVESEDPGSLPSDLDLVDFESAVCRAPVLLLCDIESVLRCGSACSSQS